MNVYTVVCTYLAKDGISNTARLFYDCGQFRSTALAVAEIAPCCPETPTDILVFQGEMYDVVAS